MKINNKLLALFEGKCECGCGGATTISDKTYTKQGIKKGEPRRFISGHQNRRFIKTHTESPEDGQFIHKGYVYVLCPDHPHRTQARYVKRSRLVVEKTLGRYLTSKEQVHHINGVRSDDRPENLQVVTLSEHNRTHRKTRRMLELRKERQG